MKIDFISLVGYTSLAVNRRRHCTVKTLLCIEHAQFQLGSILLATTTSVWRVASTLTVAHGFLAQIHVSKYAAGGQLTPHP